MNDSLKPCILINYECSQQHIIELEFMKEHKGNCDQQCPVECDTSGFKLSFHSAEVMFIYDTNKYLLSFHTFFHLSIQL